MSTATTGAEGQEPEDATRQQGQEPAADHNPDLEAREAAMRERLTGVAQEPPAEDPPPAAETTQDEEPAAGDPPAGNEDDAPAGEEPTGDDAAAGEEPGQEAPKAEQPPEGQEPKDEQPDPEEAKWHPQAQRTVKKLRSEAKSLRDRMKAAQSGLKGLADVCAESGLDPRHAPDALAIFGRAFVRKDPAALQALAESIEKAGYKPAAAAPAIDLDALEREITQAENSYDFGRVRELLAKAKGAPGGTQAAPTQPRPQPQPTAPQPPAQPDPARIVQRQAAQAELGKLEAEIRAKFGQDAERAARAIQAAAQADIQRAADSGADHLIPGILRGHFRAELARRTGARAPTPTVPPARRAAPPADPIAAKEAAIRRRLTGR